MDVQKLIKRLEGTRYVWWQEGMRCGPAPPFYAADAPPPSDYHVRRDGINCAGLINLIRRALSLPIAGVATGDYYAGGTYAWTQHFQTAGLLDKYNPTCFYPAGTLLVRPYADPEDQGHLAVLLEQNQVGHAIPGRGIVIEPLLNPSYFQYIVRPQDWLVNRVPT
jgi:hypothetical protein